MQYVNDDMDEIFRRAAENYPLDTSGSDWNKVMAAMQANEGTKEPERKKRRFLWLFLLVPAALIGSYFIQRNYNPSDPVKSESTSVPSSDKKAAEIPASPTQNINGDQPRNNIDAGSAAAIPPAAPAASTGDGRPTRSGPPAGVMPGIEPGTLNAPSKLADKPRRTKVSKAGPIDRYASGLKSIKGKFHRSANDGPAKNLTAGTSGAFVTEGQTRNFFLSHLPIDPFGRMAQPGLANAFEKSLVSGPPAKNSVPQKSKRFYAGVVAGLDATTIKLQEIKNAGNDFGMLAGYEINRKWSVELSVLLDKKFYYTDGKYFDASKVYMPPNSRITKLTGNCRMIEIPIAAKYNFSTSQKSTAFIAAGLSSYIMKKENYSYVYYYSAVNASATHKKSYSNSSKNLFSVVHLSGGYSHKIGREGNFRIEPYLKIPVTGVGFGSLPLLSTGLHIVYTRRLF